MPRIYSGAARDQEKFIASLFRNRRNVCFMIYVWLGLYNTILLSNFF